MPNFVTTDELLGQAQKLYKDAKELLAKETVTSEDIETSQKLMKEASEVKARIDALRSIESASVDVQKAIDESKKNPHGDDKNQPAGFKSFGEQLKAIYDVTKWGKLNADARLKWYNYSTEETKNLNEAVGADGGFLVQPEFSSRMLQLMAEQSIVRTNGATVIPMNARSIQIPVLDQTGSTAGVSNYYGGIRVYMQAEASSATASQPAFRQIELVANKQLGYTVASEELLADSAISLEAFLTGRMGFPGAMSHEQDYLFINGNGVGQPLGILNSGATLTVARTVQANVTYTDLVNMEEKFYTTTGRGVWVASQSLKAKLMLMQDPNGDYIWSGATSIPGVASASVPATLLGRPISFTLDQLPRATTTSNGDLMLVDFSYYLIGDRQNIVMESSREANFQTGQIAWRAVARFDGQPWMSAPLTSRDGTT